MEKEPVNLSLDCHAYDTRMTDQLRRLMHQVREEEKDLLPPQVALRWFYDQNELTPLSRNMLSTIERDRAGNVETTNGHPWDCLLVFPYLQRKCDEHRDLLLLLNEQLEDMTRGSCPQGRLYRLIQLVLW